MNLRHSSLLRRSGALTPTSTLRSLAVAAIVTLIGFTAGPGHAQAVAVVPTTAQASTTAAEPKASTKPRAASTRSYLVARGVDGRRIAIDGMGERHPIASNDTADGRARNRRVEIFVGERPR